MKRKILIRLTLGGILTIGACSFITACAPEPEAPPERAIKFDFGPVNSDVALDLSKINEKTGPSINQWPFPKKLTAQQKLDFAENTLALGQAFQMSDLKESAVQIVRNFRKDHQPTSVTFDNSPYVEAIVGTAQKEAEQQVADAQKFLPEDQKKIDDFLAGSQKTYPWPQGPLKYPQSLKVVEDYLQFVLNQLPKLNLNPLVLQNVQTEIPRRGSASLRQVREELANVQVAKNSVAMIDKILLMIKNLEFPLSTENTALLKQGKNLAYNNSVARDEQDVLSIVIQIWRLLSAEDRKELIGYESAELYSFLKDASSSRLKCLETRGCKRDLVVWVGKNTKILPQIRSRGVTNLKEKINASMMTYILAQVDAEVLKAVVTLPTMIVEQINEAFSEKLAEIEGIKKDFPGYIKKIAESWQIQKLSSSNGQILGFEQIDAQTPATTAMLLGEALMVKTRILNSEPSSLSPDEKIQWSLEHLNKLLALGGYKKNPQTSVGAMAQPIDIHFGEMKLTLEEILQSKYSFAVPDQVSLKSAYVSNLNSVENFNVSVRGQARLLRGFSESIQFLKDWQITSFDPILGQETLSGAFGSAPTSVGDRKLFPKETLFALSVGNAAIILKNLLKDLTPVFVVAQENQIIWVNNFDISSANAISMAGVVNLVGGKRDVKVSAVDLSEYMTAMTEFTRATQGVENTKSPYLLEPGANGRINVVDLLEAQQEVKILVVGLGNFLSNRMVAGDGWVHEFYALKTGQIEAGEIQITTQFTAIGALLQAYEVTKLTPYLWTAIDLYYKLNREKYDVEKGFYTGIDTLEEGVRTVKILKALQPHLPENSRPQLDQLLNSWTHLIQFRLKSAEAPASPAKVAI